MPPKYAESASCQEETLYGASPLCIVPRGLQNRSVPPTENAFPQFMSCRHAVPADGDLRNPENRTDFDRVELLQIPENKHDPLLATEAVETLANPPGKVCRLDLLERARILGPHLAHEGGLQVLHGDHRLPSRPAPLVVDGMDRYPIEPLEENVTTAEAPDVAEDLDEGVLAG